MSRALRVPSWLLRFVLGFLTWWMSWLASSAARAAEEDKPGEFTLVPFAGGDSDVGFGGGFIASWARVSSDYKPYLLRVEGASALTFKRQDDAWTVPFTDAYILVDAPHVLPNRLKLRLRISYTREPRLPYSGVGNASTAPPDPSADANRYGRVHPTVDLQSELRITRVTRFTWGISYTPNSLKVPEGSRLAQDMQSSDPALRRILGSAQDHSVLLFSYGIAFDGRDDVVNPTRGGYAAARIDLAPGESGSFRHRFARANGNARLFVPILDPGLVLAGRVVGDFLLGDAPFYELPRYDSTSAIGGGSGVRGIPAQRYWGKIKAFGNLELRAQLFRARLFSKETRFGLTGFFDAGRVWADYSPHPELDGDSLGLKFGTGAGLRIASGKSFVLRFDVAWSRESNPVGVYLTSGHTF
ncbi:MAG: BamA/TamA family outer membrane protein [Polyangiaceae bacterium]